MEFALHYLPEEHTKEQTFFYEINHHPTCLGLVKGDRPIPDVLLFHPQVVKALVERGVKVFVQRGYADHTSMTDMDYANVGADIVDDFVALTQLAKILVKFSPFTDIETQILQNGQIIVSRVLPSELDVQYINVLAKKKISAVAINFIKGKDGWSVLDNILMSSTNAEIMTQRLAHFILPLIESLLFSNNLRYGVQTNPALLESMYCYRGTLCNKMIATQLDVMWKDILSICFDLN